MLGPLLKARRQAALAGVDHEGAFRIVSGE
jgi:hypothetical protein